MKRDPIQTVRLIDRLEERGFWTTANPPQGCWQYQNERYIVTVPFYGEVTVEKRGGSNES